MPRWVIWSGRRRWIGVPLNEISPSSILPKPVMQLKKVVFPAPFGPMMLTMVCSGISKSNELTATRPPKRLVTFLAVRMDITTSLLSLGFLLGKDWFGVLRRIFLMQFPERDGGRPEARRFGKHHDDQCRAIKQEAVLRDLAQEFW